MPRLFVAISLPNAIKDQLVGLCDFSLLNAYWTDYEHFHLTLRFIGEVDGRVFDDIREVLATIEWPTFSLVLKGIGHFPPRKRPKILWVGVEKNDALIQLRNKIEQKMIRLNLAPDRRKFTPHITLAKLHQTPEDEIGMYIAYNNLFRTDPFEVSDFHLYSSVLSSQGATHHQEATYGLN